MDRPDMIRKIEADERLAGHLTGFRFGYMDFGTLVEAAQTLWEIDQFQTLEQADEILKAGLLSKMGRK